MAADPLVGKVLADRFEILERIGEGGTGVVYKAKQITVDRDIAIKVLGAHVSSDPQWVKRFHNEARAAARLHHTNTVQLIDFGQTKEGLLFIAMELLAGHSLRDEMDRVGKMPPDRALRILIQGCASVGEAHAQGIIHRDIKPDNLYLVEMKGAGDFVKVLDFSVAKMDDAGAAQQTRAGIVFGTPAYMSPEQGRGAKLGPQSDIYAFGIVLYEMLAGKPPFDSKIPTEVVMMHLRDKPQPIPGLPPALEALLMKTLDKDPARRQPTCEELGAECEQVLYELYPRQTPGGMRPATGPVVPIAGPSGGGAAAPGNAVGIAVVPPAAGSRGNQAPPMVSGSSNSSGKPSSSAPLEQKTVMGDALDLQPARSPSAAGAARRAAASAGAGMSGQATMMADAPGYGGEAQPSTMLLPDSQGVVAFAVEKAHAARVAAADSRVPEDAGAPWFFWVAWVLLGVGLGVTMHFTGVLRHIGQL